MTLTTERQQFESWFTNKYPRSYWGVEKTASGEYQGGLAAPLWEAWQESRRGLTNREAQPVALVYSSAMPRFIGDTNEVEGYRCWIHGEARLVPTMEQAYADAKAVCTTPPAPAVVNGRTAEGWMAEALLQKKITDDIRKSAPAVVKLPTEFYSDEGIVVRLEQVMAALALVGVKYERRGDACRAAMLAQPVSSDYKLVPVEPTENMIIDGFESDAFMALADAVNEKNGWPYGCKESAECVEGIFKAMLSAAPEGGNG